MMTEEKSVQERRFNAAVKVLRNLPDDGLFQLSDELKLRFYGYYKQATKGPCNIPKPGFWDSEGKAKWEAWNSLGDMWREEAMTAYIEEMKIILETIPVTDEVEELLDVLGPFYEIEEEELMSDSKSKGARDRKGNDLLVEMNGKLGSSSNNSESGIIESEEDDDEEDEEEAEDEQQEEQGVDNAELKAEGTSSGLFMDHRTLSSCSMGHSVSSAASGAHSSLNSENLEEELTRIASAQEDSLCVYREDISDLLLTSDSDNEVYCDSIEQFGTVSGHGKHLNQPLQLTGDTHRPLVSSADFDALQKMVNQECIQGGGKGMQSRGEQDAAIRKNMSQRDSFSSDEQESTLSRRGKDSSSSGLSSRSQAHAGFQKVERNGDPWTEEGRTVDGVEKMIVMALFQLEEDMQHVLQKLHTLETLSEDQARKSSWMLKCDLSSQDASWWPFGASLCTMVFAVAWPFMVHWLVQLYLQRQSRLVIPYCNIFQRH
ncbi:acyl-CoA-binding domain-containing protein 5-like [Arapaima gigas]